jgi:hypothetical protein
LSLSLPRLEALLTAIRGHLHNGFHSQLIGTVTDCAKQNPEHKPRALNAIAQPVELDLRPFMLTVTCFAVRRFL